MAAINMGEGSEVGIERSLYTESEGGHELFESFHKRRGTAL